MITSRGIFKDDVISIIVSTETLKSVLKLIFIYRIYIFVLVREKFFSPNENLTNESNPQHSKIFPDQRIYEERKSPNPLEEEKKIDVN